MNIRRELQLRLKAANLLVLANKTSDAVEQADLRSRAQRIIGLADAQAHPQTAIGAPPRNGLALYPAVLAARD